jgi:hypothetical protein
MKFLLRSESLTSKENLLWGVEYLYLRSRAEPRKPLAPVMNTWSSLTSVASFVY